MRRALVKRGLAIALGGTAIVVVVAAGCSGNKPGTTTNTSTETKTQTSTTSPAAEVPTAKVTIDGKDQSPPLPPQPPNEPRQVPNGAFDCTKEKGNDLVTAVNIGGSGAVSVKLSKDKPQKVISVNLGVI